MKSKVALISHRGYRQKFPENTMLSFREALERGALGFTCDDPKTCGEILDRLGERKLKD